MAEQEEKKKTLSLGGSKATLSLKGGVATPGAAGQVQQSFSGGRSKPVAVEVRRKKRVVGQDGVTEAGAHNPDDGLTPEERESRMRALEIANLEADKREEERERRRKEAEDITRMRHEDQEKRKEDLEKQQETKSLEQQREEEQQKLKEIEATRSVEEKEKQQSAISKFASQQRRPGTEEDEEQVSYRERIKRAADAKKPVKARTTEDDRRGGKLTVAQVLNQDYERDRGPSMAARKRALEKGRMKAQGNFEPPKKMVREVVLPEVITVQELSNRMAERSANVVKKLMQMGIMATLNQSLDADTAELLIEEFGHKAKRVTEGDVEIGIRGAADAAEDLQPRAPVVTVMGHVDHGKTSLLDAFRATDVVSGEAGGITQHIGAYQVEMAGGGRITFLDTPGHAAFSQMRARGANITDIVVLVVAANDSVMPQTIEAIRHAKAAKVPIIVAINKIDLPDANPSKIKQDLLHHEIVVEDMGGDTLCVEISAKKRLNLEKLEEAIMLQAEILELKANANRTAEAIVVESKMEKGRGSVATVLIQRGTLRIGDIFVTGSEWGRVRVIINDHGKQIKEATPGMPVEVLGLNSTPDAGDDFIVVENESKAREIADYRLRKKKDAQALLGNKAQTMDQLFANANNEGRKTLAVIVKADVHGSIEAISGSLKKIADDNTDIEINVIHSGVGAITESDITLSKASNALIIGFNVRANTQARELATMENVKIMYYSIIYDAIDDVKNILTGMLEPTIREEFIGNAEIREVFNITKVGKIAGCFVVNGFVKKGAKVRLLRDNVVIHEGKLKTLKRFKDEVKEVKEGTECGMAFESYDDLKAGDVIECFDLISEKQEVV